MNFGRSSPWVAEDTSERVVRWTPLSEPFLERLVTIRIDYGEDENLIVSAKADGGILRCRFGYVEAFKVAEEFSAERPANAPFFEGNDPDRLGPLREVLNSKWVARVLYRNGQLGDRKWRHFAIVTGVMCIDVMTDDSATAEFIAQSL